MNEARLTPFSGRVAHESLRGSGLDARHYTAGEWARIAAPLVDLLRAPAGPRDRQLLRGARVCIIDRRDGHAFVQAEACGYCGWVATGALGADHPVTHRVTARATHLYSAPDLKSPELALLSLNAQIEITLQEGDFLRTADDHWLPAQHLAPIGTPATNPVEVALRLLGTPYLWGGNSASGLDCSALVQLAHHACNLPCPGDSDLQALAFADARVDPQTLPQSGDLLFWRGHVAFVHDPQTMLHATAHSMAVTLEPLAQAMTRIAAKTPLLAHVRLQREPDTRLS
ncbi:MAG: C40 family peptidase [Rhodobacteraceae bacterium]|nr:C40 family peptidase [Paracoccaceae bacterium]